MIPTISPTTTPGTIMIQLLESNVHAREKTLSTEGGCVIGLGVHRAGPRPLEQASGRTPISSVMEETTASGRGPAAGIGIAGTSISTVKRPTSGAPRTSRV